MTESLASDYAARIQPLLADARKARGLQSPSNPYRAASDQVNVLLLDFDKRGGNASALARELEGLSIHGIRRRLRSARAGHALGQRVEGTTGHGRKDSASIQTAVGVIKVAQGTPDYQRAVKEVYASGVNLRAVARELGVSYYTLWMAMRS